MSHKQPLILFGASGLAKEIIEAVRLLNEFEVIGILDDDTRKYRSELLGVPVVGTVSDHIKYSDAKYVNCVAGGRTSNGRFVLRQSINISDERFATVVHPGAFVSPSAKVGFGSVVLAACVLTADLKVGNHCVLMPSVVLTHDDQISDGVIFASGVTVGGHVEVHQDAYLGQGSVVRERIVLGNRCVVGMGSVVTKDVPDNEVWVGNPARFLRSNQ